MKRNNFIIVVALVFFALVFYIRRIILTSDDFRISDIITDASISEDLSYLKGKNIFTLDLKEEAKRLLRFYPSFKKIRVVKYLPNKIYVDFIRRRPLAVIRLYRDFYIDENLVLFDLQECILGQELPVVLGLDKKIFAPSLGGTYNIPSVVLALDIILEVAASRDLKKYRILKIDVERPKEATVFIEKGPQIKISQEDFKSKIAVLAGLVADQGGLDSIKYIDLRFKEPVIKFKDAP